MNKLYFDKALFWDIDLNNLDIKKHSKFIIERVIKRGSLEDWFYLKKIYSLDIIEKESLHIRSLDKKTLHFLSNYFGVDKSKFRCYI